MTTGNFMRLHPNPVRPSILSKELDWFMEEQGFVLERSNSDEDVEGWANVYPAGVYSYRVYVTADTIYVCKEYDCGGSIRQWSYPVKEKDKVDVNSFLYRLDSAYEHIQA